MTVLDVSVAVKWFVRGEPHVDEARDVLDDVERDPRPYLVPELFMNELLAVLSRFRGISTAEVREALSLVESLGLARVGNGHDLLARAAAYACEWGVSGYDAVYLALAKLSGGVWLTADAKAARKVRAPGLARLLGG